MLTTLYVCLLVVFPDAALVEVKTIAVAGVVYAVVQVLKQAPVLQPYIVGWKAVLLNIVLSVAGVLAVLTPDQFFTTQTLVSVLTVALAAAGVHGTATKLIQQAKDRATAKALNEKAAALKQMK